MDLRFPYRKKQLLASICCKHAADIAACMLQTLLRLSANITKFYRSSLNIKDNCCKLAACVQQVCSKHLPCKLGLQQNAANLQQKAAILWRCFRKQARKPSASMLRVCSKFPQTHRKTNCEFAASLLQTAAIICKQAANIIFLQIFPSKATVQ